MFADYLGRDYTMKEMKNAIYQYWDGEVSVSENICRDTAELIFKDKIIGWFQGRSEFGPRALGHRSIIANPCNKDMKDVLNHRVKFREHFRPFAPIILKEYVREYFCEELESPYMLIVKQVKEDKVHLIPSVVHVDQTARLQTISNESDERLYRLIEEFCNISKVPVILNTSFNIQGEPIVESPEDALRCFVSTDIDVLVMDRFILCKKV